jgi:hypothetical protein
MAATEHTVDANAAGSGGPSRRDAAFAVAPARSTAQRRADVLAMLEGEEHVWIATGGRRVHLIPLACAWDGRRLVMATNSNNRTVRNLYIQPRTRIALGTPKDVVLMDGDTEVLTPVDITDEDSAILAALPLDPTRASGRVCLSFVPDRILTWRDRGEIADRVVMDCGKWLG